MSKVNMFLIIGIDVLLVAKHNVGNLCILQTCVSMVPKGSELLQIINNIRSGQLELSGFRVLVIMTGRADVLDRSVSVPAQLEELRQVVSKVDPAMIILLCTPIPWAGDSERLTQKLQCTGPVFKAFCQGKLTMAFSRAMQNFTTELVLMKPL